MLCITFTFNFLYSFHIYDQAETNSSCRSDSRVHLCVSVDGQRRCECFRVSAVRPHQSDCQLITQRTPAVTPSLCPVSGSTFVKVHNEPHQICQNEPRWQPGRLQNTLLSTCEEKSTLWTSVTHNALQVTHSYQNLTETLMFSVLLHLSWGIPQGSDLGPQLFFI